MALSAAVCLVVGFAILQSRAAPYGSCDGVRNAADDAIAMCSEVALAFFFLLLLLIRLSPEDSTTTMFVGTTLCAVLVTILFALVVIALELVRFGQIKSAVVRHAARAVSRLRGYRSDDRPLLGKR